MSQLARDVRRQGMRISARPTAVRAESGVEPRLQRLLDLQQSAGNAAVVQLVGEDEAEGGATGDGGGGTDTTEADNFAAAKAVFDKGAAAYDARDYAHAADYFAKAFELSPRPGILFSQGQSLRRLGGRADEAVRCYEDYLATGHGVRDAEARQYIAELSVPPSSGDLIADTKTAKAIFDRGAALYAQGDFAHAYDEFSRAYELSLRPQLLFSRAQTLRRLGGRREEAIADYQAYIDSGETARAAEAQQFITALRAPTPTGELEKDTATGRSIFNAGAASYERGDYAHAYDEFSRAYELTERPSLQFSRAQALRRLGGRTEEAIDLYQSYIDSGETNRAAEAQQLITTLQEQGAAPR